MKKVNSLTQIKENTRENGKKTCLTDMGNTNLTAV